MCNIIGGLFPGSAFASDRSDSHNYCRSLRRKLDRRRSYLSGRQVTVGFRVRAGAIVSFTYSYRGRNGLTCTSIEHQQISTNLQPKIGEAGFTASLGEDLDRRWIILFGEAGDWSYLAGEWKGRYNCSMTIETDWTASKSQSSAQSSVVAPVTSSWCGKNVSCRNLLASTVDLRACERFDPGAQCHRRDRHLQHGAHAQSGPWGRIRVDQCARDIRHQCHWAQPELAGCRSAPAVLAGVLLGAVVFGVLLSVGVESWPFGPFAGAPSLPH